MEGFSQHSEFDEEKLPLYEAAAARDEGLKQDLLLREQILSMGAGDGNDRKDLRDVNARIAAAYEKLKRAA